MKHSEVLIAIKTDIGNATNVMSNLRKFTPEKIEAGLTHKLASVRSEYASCKDLTRDQIERGLTDKNSKVRLIFAKRKDYTPTLEEIERGLTDRSFWIRIAFARRTDYVFTPRQIERGLTDEVYLVRRQFFISLGPYMPPPQLIEVGLTHENAGVRYSFAKRENYAFTSAQIERGLADEDVQVRLLFARRIWNGLVKDNKDISPLLQGSIDLLRLTVRSVECLRWESIYYIRDLILYTENDLLQIPDFSRKSLEEVKEALAEHGLSLGMVFTDALAKYVLTKPPILQRSLVDAGLTIRSLNCLQAEGIHTVSNLICLTETELLHMPNFGRRSLNEIKEFLARHGLSLGQVPE